MSFYEGGVLAVTLVFVGTVAGCEVGASVVVGVSVEFGVLLVCSVLHLFSPLLAPPLRTRSLSPTYYHWWGDVSQQVDSQAPCPM